jgi:hypothetical protein
MLREQHRQILRDAHAAFKLNGDPQIISDAIELVKELAPDKFLQEDKDLLLAKRVFVHQPNSAHWSGTALTSKRAW